MDRISELSDELLVKILSLLSTKFGVSTSILSKRWEFVWMWLPKVNYGDRHCSVAEGKRLYCFLDRNLPLFRAPVFEKLVLEFSDQHVEPKDMKLWVIGAVSRTIHELYISYGSYQEERNILPSNLYTCKSLVTLTLDGKILLDVPRMVCLPSLKTLHLKCVKYFNEDSFQRLLSNCPLLEDLLVRRNEGESMIKFTVSVTSLQRLSLYIPYDIDEFVINTPSLKYFKLEHDNSKIEVLDILPSNLYSCESLVTLKLDGKILLDVPRMVCLPCLKTLHLKDVKYFNEDCLQRLLTNCPVLEDLLVNYSYGGENMKKFDVIAPSLQRLSIYIPYDVEEFVINTPSLKYLELVHHNSKSHYFSIENMPELREAIVDVQILDHLKSLIRSIASVKRLEFCLTSNTSEGVYGDGFVFNNLEHLKLCSCPDYLSNILVWLLKVSPNLRVLDLCQMDGHYNEGLVYWTQPSTVPECMFSSLQTFEWSGYLGRPQDRDLVAYILENTHRLKTATISTYEDCLDSKFDMVKELACCSRASAACKLVFDC